MSWPSTRNLFQGCLALWAVGFLAGCFGIVRSWRKLHLILRDARPIDDPGLQSIVRQVQTALATTRPFRVITSDTLQSPVAARMYRPVIMLPEELSRQLSPSEMRLVLLHEGAHIIRHDHVTLLAERVFVAAFWFHPLVHLLVRQLARAREEVCDNYVLQNIDAPSFGETLLRLTNLTSSRSQVAYGVVSSSRS